ncbi:hypothetical protein PoB_001239800 [Plakobranchus ocellatus]|uniref:Uncharacterized protein n=1 Tax=Plakobranchus ocellatus TaxID=259542 RepID=A0AAV3YTM6_9GAST|nr:hypothetical protein PoB_001239800 [Plakobranchus ocellatus]
MHSDVIIRVLSHEPIRCGSAATLTNAMLQFDTAAAAAAAAAASVAPAVAAACSGLNHFTPAMYSHQNVAAVHPSLSTPGEGLAPKSQRNPGTPCTLTIWGRKSD